MNVGQDLVNKITVCENSHFADFMPQRVTNSMYLTNVTASEILNTAKMLNNKHYCGYGDFSMSLVK